MGAVRRRTAELLEAARPGDAGSHLVDRVLITLIVANVLATVIRKEARVLGVASFILAVLLVVASWGMFLLEHDAQPVAFGTIPDAMWWAVVTLTTVGFGDVVPVTPWGKVFAGFVALLGIGMVALPSAVLVSGFGREVRHRTATYRNAVEKALADGSLSSEEEQRLETLREELGLNTDDALQAELTVRRHVAGLDRCPHCGESLFINKKEKQDGD